MREAITGFHSAVERIPARRLSRRIVLFSATAVFAMPFGRTACAEEKASKQQAGYQDSPNGIASCATCTLFVAPHACKVVDGTVNPDGWCKLYAMAD